MTARVCMSTGLTFLINISKTRTTFNEPNFTTREMHIQSEFNVSLPFTMSPSRLGFLMPTSGDFPKFLDDIQFVECKRHYVGPAYSSESTCIKLEVGLMTKRESGTEELQSGTKRREKKTR